MATSKQERIFNPTGWRHYRRRYSLTEVRIGLIILAGLAALAVWVFWRGANPDPELFSVNANLLDEGSDFQPLDGTKGISQSPNSAAAGTAQDRGPVPDDLAASGWTEQPVAQFDSSNLYEKINGREGYYKSFGFQRLYYISLLRDDDETAAIDIEMYDLGSVSNALGAYSGERQADAQPEVTSTGISHLSRNAIFIVQGRFYIRAIGSDETELIVTQLEHLRARFNEGLSGESLPWAYSLFVGQLDLDAGKINYAPENAFSFGFANHVYSVEIDDDGTELFITVAPDEAAANALAGQFAEGFQSYGAVAGNQDGIDWVKDQYLDTMAGATSTGQVVVGIRGAPSLEVARSQVGKLKEAAAALPASLLEAALQAQKQNPGGGGYGDDESSNEAADDASGEPPEGGGNGESEGEGEGEEYGGEAGYGEGEGGDPGAEERGEPSLSGEEVEEK